MKSKAKKASRLKQLCNEARRILNLGLDVHYWQVTVAMQEDGGRIKVVGKMSHEAFLGWVRRRWRKDGRSEAVTKLELVATGYIESSRSWESKTWWSRPGRWGQTGQKQKTDKRDAVELCDTLDRYLRGQDRAFSVVQVPTLKRRKSEG